MARIYTADQIEVIESDRLRVRSSPSMYVPDIYLAGYYHLLWELISNSIDELMAPDSTSRSVTVYFDKKTHTFGVDDDGAGIPLEKLRDVLTKLAASGKFHNGDGGAYLTSGGRWGHGLKACVFLAKNATFSSFRDGKYITYTIKDGEIVDEKHGKSDQHGTSCRFDIDPAIINHSDADVKEIEERLQLTSYIYPDLKIKLIVLENGKEVEKIKYGGKDIVDKVKKWKPDTPILRITKDQKVTYLKTITDDDLTTETVYIDLAFAYSEASLDKEANSTILTICNGINTYLMGTHWDGLKLGIQKFFKENVIPKFKGKDKDLNILPSDMTTGIAAFITVRVVDPIFTGQEKAMLMNQEVKTAVRDAVYEYLCNAKSSEINSMVDFVKRVTRGRISSKKTRKKDVSNAFSKDALDKFYDITYNLKTEAPELLLVEGDSALDNAALARDQYNQALYPIKRPKNVFDMDAAVVNRMKTTFNDVLDICGISAGKDCDPGKSLMTRILVLTDGDVDGDDICIGVVCLLWKHCRPMIDAGMVGRILPPAYAIPIGKDRYEFVRSQREFFGQIVKKFIKKHTVFYLGKELKGKDLRQFIEINFEYDTTLEALANRYCCDPKVMEYIAWNYHGDWKDQKKSNWQKIMRRYSGIRVLEENGTLVLDGDIPGADYMNLALDKHFHKHVNRFKEHQKQNGSLGGYTIDGEKEKTLYDVMHTVRDEIPKSVRRFKGLGELDPDEIRDLCLDREKRTVVVFKSDDFEKDEDKINVMLSSKKEWADARKDLVFKSELSLIDLDT